MEAQKADLELYDYVSRELYSRYRRAYGPSPEEDVRDFQATQRHSFNG
jgi:hypothetical protein